MNDSNATIIETHDLQKVYSGWSLGRRRRIEAVRGVTLRARAGEVFGLLGPNGAGKTTLVKMLLGVVKPTSGTATLFGRKVGSHAARVRVGYLPESLRVDHHHTARSALRFYGQMSRMSGGEISRRSDELLELVGLEGRDRESVRRFSKGMYQRLGLAQALMHDPDLLILDEPTDGLDPVGRNEVRRVIERLRDAGKAIFLNSHILQEVELVCTRAAILARGKIRAIGTLDELARGGDCDQVMMEMEFPSAVDSPPGWSASVAEGALRHGADNDDFRGEMARFFDSQQISDLEFQDNLEGRAARFTARVANQTQVDAMVDWLRGQGVSIRRLQFQRPTLEQTFMRLVGESAVMDNQTMIESGERN